MMKKMMSVLLLAFMTFTASANTIEEAKDLYSKRGLEGDSRNNARRAAEIYLNLANTRSTDLERAQMLSKASEAVYFDAFIMPDKPRRDKMDAYWKGYELGLQAVNLLGTSAGDDDAPVNPKDSSYTKDLALAMYWMGANVGRWGKLKGPFTALDKWRKILKPRIEDLFRLDPNVENYGAHRIAGGALNVLGGTVNYRGTERDALSITSEAYEESKHTVNGIETSICMSTNIFYLDSLRKADSVDQFCALYENIKDIFADGDSMVSLAFPIYIPEAYIEYNENFLGDKNFHRFYSKNCQ